MQLHVGYYFQKKLFMSITLPLLFQIPHAAENTHILTVQDCIAG